MSKVCDFCLKESTLGHLQLEVVGVESIKTFNVSLESVLKDDDAIKVN